MTNGLVTVAVDRNDGTFAVDGVAGFGRLVDGGDHGDSYNYSPPAGDRIVDTPDHVSVTVAERGPVRAVITHRGPLHLARVRRRRDAGPHRRGERRGDHRHRAARRRAHRPGDAPAS